MKFALDDKERFMLTAKEGGWELVVDGKMVHYCLSPVEAVKYMTETMTEESSAVGVRQVVEALAGVEAAALLAAKVVNFSEVAGIVARVWKRTRDIRDRKQRVIAASMELACCTEDELRVRADRHEIVAQAKAILTPFTEGQDERAQ